MLSFPTSQGIAVHHTRQTQRQAGTHVDAADATPQTGDRRLVLRIFDLLVEARTCKAHIELEQHHRSYMEHLK